MTNETSSPPKLLAETSAPSATAPGRVWFVGAGPGAADLLTVRALRLLESADAVLYDVLVPPHLLGSLRPEVERIPVCRNDPSTGTRLIDPGAEVGKRLVRLAQAGRRVVRLKGGDPLVFARFAEETRPLQEAGIPFDVVPGITAATAAAAAVQTPLTSRSHAASVTLITGHRGDHAASHADRPPTEDFARLASLPGTIVVYMGLEKIGQWSQALLDAGCRGDRPVAVISRCAWPDERRCTTTLAELCSDETIRTWPSPAVILVGDVISASGESGPCCRTPLAGQTVLVTRPAGQAADVLKQLHGAGAHGICVPVVEIVPPASWEPLDAAIREAWSYDWIVFSSANGVEAFANRLAAAGDARLLGTARLAAVGPKTAAALAEHRLACDLVPATHSAAGLVDAMASEPPGRRFLLIQADRGRDTLQAELAARQHEVQRVTGYISRDVPQLDDNAENQLNQHQIDWVMLSSPAITTSAIQLFGDRLANWKTACNSQAAADLLASHGLQATVISSTPSMAALIEAMTAWEAACREEQPLGGRG